MKLRRNQSPRRVISWDIDKTLGLFVAAAFNRKTLFGKNDIPPFAIVEGIESTLSALNAAGFTHAASGSETKAHINRVLSMVDLDHYFKAVAGSETTMTYAGKGKMYEPLAEELGFNVENAETHWLVVGDSLMDMPGDFDNGKPVFIHYHNHAINDRPLDWERDVPEYDARVIRTIVKTLLRGGHGNHREGFAKLMKRGRVRQSGTRYFEARGLEVETRPGYREIDLGYGIRCGAAYIHNPSQDTDEPIPILTDVRASQQYARPLRKITSGRVKKVSRA